MARFIEVAGKRLVNLDRVVMVAPGGYQNSLLKPEHLERCRRRQKRQPSISTAARRMMACRLGLA
jgi:hypothetical protein